MAWGSGRKEAGAVNDSLRESQRLRARRGFDLRPMRGPTAPPVVVLTGATGALGGATAVALARRGATVVLLVRDSTRGSEARQRVQRALPTSSTELVIADLSDPSSVRRAATSIRATHPRLQGLILCAATFSRTRQVTPRGLELMFATNHLGPFVLAQDLLPALEAGAPARVITVSAPSTSKLDFADLQSAKRFGSLSTFGATKAANLLFAYALAQKTAGTGVTSNVFYPGLVRSRLMREAPVVIRGLVGLMSRGPERAGEALATLALDPEFADVSGRFFRLTTMTDTSAYSRDPENQRRLWEVSEHLSAPAPA